MRKAFSGTGRRGERYAFCDAGDRAQWKQIWDEDLVPYRELHAEMPMMMMNHAAYPRDAGQAAAGKRIAFLDHDGAAQADRLRGIILSDDLEMGGILKFMPVEEAAIAAIRAGSDLLEICHSPELILRSYEALIAEASGRGVSRSAACAGASNGADARSGFMQAAWRGR